MDSHENYSMKFVFKVPQMKEVLMFFEYSPIAKALLQAAIILIGFCFALILLAVAWRIAGL